MSAIAEPKLSTDAPRRRGRPRAAVRHERSLHARDWLEYLALRAAFAALAAVPLAVALRAGEFAALAAYVLDRPHRRIGMRNLEIAFRDKKLRARRRILRASFLHLGLKADELAHLPRLPNIAIVV